MAGPRSPRRPRPASRRPSGPRIVFQWSQVSVGTFDCWPDDERWQTENLVDEGHVMAFPGTAVEIIQDGHDPVVADPNRVVLYNREQTYRRRLVSRTGDHCTFLVIAPELLEELARAGAAPISDPERRPFARPELPISRDDHLEQRSLLGPLAGARATDALELQERLVRLVARALRPPPSPPRRVRGRRRPGTEHEHRQLSEAVRAVIAADPGRPMSLDEIARQVGASVFHLSRVFRQHAGMSLHAFRDELRLRTALPAVLDGSRSLTELALEYGYASPSHFTDRFRARYGMAPSQLRATRGRATRISAPA